MSNPPRRWSTDEDAILKEAAEAQIAAYGEVKSWSEVATKLSGRSNKDCRKRFYNEVTGGLKKGGWTREEDNLLQTYIASEGPQWAVIAQKMKTRSADQCSKRWQHFLDPNLDHSSWTHQENINLLVAVNTHGSCWKDIHQLHFPERSTNNIRNQYTIIKRKPLEIPPGTRPCCPEEDSHAQDQNPHVPQLHDHSMADLIDFDPSRTWQDFETFDGLTTPNLNSYGDDDGFGGVSSSSNLAGSSTASPIEPDFSSLLSARPAIPAPIFSASGAGSGPGLMEPGPPADAMLTGLSGSVPRKTPQLDLALPDSLHTLVETPLPSSSATSQSPSANSAGGLRTTITLDNVQPGTLVAVMDLLIKSRANLKFETKA